jgi:hypothetical protein
VYKLEKELEYPPLDMEKFALLIDLYSKGVEYYESIKNDYY